MDSSPHRRRRLKPHAIDFRVSVDPVHWFLSDRDDTRSSDYLEDAVRRNRGRFPGDFLIDLTNQEVARSRSQIVTLKGGRGSNVKYLPMAFTEHGAIMAATILNSPRAEQMSVYVVRAFVKLRESLTAHTELVRELATLKGRGDTPDVDTRKQFEQVYEAILGLMSPTVKKQ